MKPLFFPFTYVRDKDAEIILSLFDGFYFFTTSSVKELETECPYLINDSRVEPVFMDDSELLPVLETAKEYTNWAMLNRGNLDSLKSLFRKQPYFTSDTGVASIKSEIGRRSKTGTEHEKSGNHDTNFDFLNTLLFLRFAHESDAEHDAIDHKLEFVLTWEKELFSEVKGETRNIKDGIAAGQNYDPGLLMTEKRLLAWFDVLEAKKESCDLSCPLVLVTTSSGVADFFDSMAEDMEFSGDIEIVASIENYKVCCGNCPEGQKNKNIFHAILKDALKGGEFVKQNLLSADDGDFYYVAINVYRLAERALEKFLRNSGKQTSVSEVFCRENIHFKSISGDIFLCAVTCVDPILP